MHSFANQRAIVSLLVVINVLACETTVIREPDVINVPPGLTATQVERAIGVAIDDSSREDREMAGCELFGCNDSDAVWYVERRDPGAITAGYRNNEQYLQTRIRYTSTEVRIEIIGSKNLLQKGDRIDDEVYEWIPDLEARIRIELGKTSMRKR